MYKGKKILGLITARGGSKGIPQKNIKILAGKPLIAYTIEAAQKSAYLTRCILSTDSQEIIDLSKTYGADVPFVRPSELAHDTAKSIEVAQHTLAWVKENNHETYDYLMILQPTSPLRTSKDIDECIKKIIDTEADSVMSVVELTDFSIAKLKVIKHDMILPLATEEGNESQRRQDLIQVYKRNCAIYLTRTELIMQGDFFGHISRPYIMPEERSVDINQSMDFEFAEFFLTNHRI